MLRKCHYGITYGLTVPELSDALSLEQEYEYRCLTIQVRLDIAGDFQTKFFTRSANMKFICETVYFTFIVILIRT